MARNPVKTRYDVTNTLKTSLNPEHYQAIRQICPSFAREDDDADDLLCCLEHDEGIISFPDNNLIRLIQILEKIGLADVAKSIPDSEIAEANYEILKDKIIRMFDSKECRRAYLSKFKSKTAEFYKLDRDELDHCSFKEIIEDLEKDDLLSSRKLGRFQQIFQDCCCQEVINLIEEAKNVTEEERMDTTDTTDARTVPTTQVTTDPTQEQNPGSSRSTTFVHGTNSPGHHTTSPPSNQQWQNVQEQNPANTAATSFGRGDHRKDQTAGSYFTGHHMPANPNPTHSQQHFQAPFPPCGGYNTGTNINIGRNTHIGHFHVSSGGSGQQTSYPVGQNVPQQYPAYNPHNTTYYPGHVPHHPSRPPKPPGFLPDQALAYITNNIGREWRMLGLQLGIEWSTSERIESDSKCTSDAIMTMLHTWRRSESGNQLEIMCKALIKERNQMLADEIRKM